MRNGILLLSIALAGCSNGINSYTPASEAITNNTQKIFIGLPVVLGIEASAARLDAEWMVTVAHNAAILMGKEAYYHPTCDIAVYREHGDNLVGIGTVQSNGKVTHAGYPGLMRPMAYNDGRYVGEVVTPDYPECNMSATNAVLTQGMSGGGVYNESGQLVGVNHGFSSWTVEINGQSIEKPAIFMSLLGARDWLEEITGNDYFDEKENERRTNEMMRNRRYRRRDENEQY